MKRGHKFWIVCSGLMWFGIGLWLLLFGMKLLIGAVIEGNTYVFTQLASRLHSREQAALILVALGLLVGFFKGRMVLYKTALRVIGRIRALPEPVAFSQVYTKGYLLLIGSMVLLGMSMRWLSVPGDIRGTIDIAIGSALMNGALFYFRAAPNPARDL